MPVSKINLNEPQTHQELFDAFLHFQMVSLVESGELKEGEERRKLAEWGQQYAATHGLSVGRNPDLLNE